MNVLGLISQLIGIETLRLTVFFLEYPEEELRVGITLLEVLD